MRQSWGILWKRGRRTAGARGVKDTRKPRETTNTGSYWLTEKELTSGSLHRTDLGPLHRCYSCIAWSSCGTPNSESRDCLTLACLETFSSSGLPSPGLMTAIHGGLPFSEWEWRKRGWGRVERESGRQGLREEREMKLHSLL